ncbi:hypothetical protein B0T26DRAFT_730422 [Lasiosphaeria miniovina]|uniref:Uncharacterized protein n=1 Tax=Lasiosphaeria miniovina TaxID=1954250 RepID=A0AA39ZTA6_9PEZI|nr:uncharacterized protein B0T26DRAFT_730422 [Lasiosphaeria miniovina]KAK0703240.1 hypothetical protein B0T26DRAFT_730422 [Lasiosphaeria miniovina]
MSTQESRDRFAKVWGYHITAMNPQRGQGADESKPLSVNPLETNVTWEWLIRIVNRCQRHHCSTAYCLQLTKKDAEQARKAGERGGQPASQPVEERFSPQLTCRFQCPWAEQAKARVIRKLGKKWWLFEAQRNDTYMNQYNPLISLCWLANTNCPPCTGVQAVVNYAAE